MTLSINDIISYSDGKVYRILWIDEDYIESFCIDLDSDKPLPIMKNISEILEEIEVGIALKLEEDNYINIVDESNLTKKELEIRDNAWDIIKDLVAPKNKPNIFISKYRGKLVKSIIEDKNVDHKTVYKYLRRYWIGGQVKNALISKYSNCGGRGKNKKLGHNKVGRPRKNIQIEGEGINIDEKIKQIFKTSIKKYYYNNKKTSLTLAYQHMINEYFTELRISENGNKVVKIKKNIPTEQQFRYWFKKEHDIRTVTISREGERIYNLTNRAVTGKSSKEALYPGAVYQIDATIADVYLVSRYDRSKIIGRPTIYLVIDVFSRMITGVYVGLESPSWIGAMTALANCGMNKQKFCKEYDIDINEDDWACRCLPQVLLADRGELEGKNIETLINSLGVDVKNTAAYRADLKGIVERKFRDIHDKIKAFVPGFIDKDFRQRGSKDYRLEAALDIHEFTKIIILYILSNNKSFMNYYEREEMMIKDDVPSIPKDIWDWGIKNKGSSRCFSEKVIMLNLMPKDRASITERGIKFKNMYYSCEEAVKEGWYEEARRKGRFYKEISYDPRNIDKIYIRVNKGRDFITCRLLDESSIYKNKSIDEVNYLIKMENILKSQNNNEKLEIKINLNNSIQSIVEEAKLKNKSYQNPYTSITEKISNINENRKIEKDLNRNIEALDLEEDNLDSLVDLTTDDSVDNEEDVGTNRYMLALLKKKGLKNEKERIKK